MWEMTWICGKWLKYVGKWLNYLTNGLIMWNVTWRFGKWPEYLGNGNEAAESLAKEGTTKEQVDRSTSYPEVKTILKAKQHSKWRHKHPRYNKADPYYLLTRREQVTVFRLRTGHNRLNYHLYSKLRIGHTEQCPCVTGSQATEHLLQFCPTYEPLRKGIWPDHTPVARKLYGSLRDLRCTATFIGETGISI